MYHPRGILVLQGLLLNGQRDWREPFWVRKRADWWNRRRWLSAVKQFFRKKRAVVLWCYHISGTDGKGEMPSLRHERAPSIPKWKPHCSSCFLRDSSLISPWTLLSSNFRYIQHEEASWAKKGSSWRKWFLMIQRVTYPFPAPCPIPHAPTALMVSQ